MQATGSPANGASQSFQAACRTWAPLDSRSPVQCTPPPELGGRQADADAHPGHGWSPVIYLADGRSVRRLDGGKLAGSRIDRDWVFVRWVFHDRGKGEMGMWIPATLFARTRTAGRHCKGDKVLRISLVERRSRGCFFRQPPPSFFLRPTLVSHRPAATFCFLFLSPRDPLPSIADRAC